MTKTLKITNFEYYSFKRTVKHELSELRDEQIEGTLNLSFAQAQCRIDVERTLCLNFARVKY